MTTLLLLSSSLALAADYEISAEVGRLDVAKGGYELFGSEYGITTMGVRLQYIKNQNLSFNASYHRWVDGGRVQFGDYYYEDTEISGGPGVDEGFHTGFWGNLVGLGVRGGVDLWGWLSPYGTVELRGMRVTARFDDDPSQDDNPNQITLHGASVGFAAAAGLSLRIPSTRGFTVSHYTEFGYEAMTPLSLGTAGDIAFRGLHIRSGLGVRF